MRIEWTTKVLKSLSAEFAYIGKDDVQAAQNVGSAILSSLKALSDFPSMGRAGRVYGTRELVLAKYPYIIPYKIHNNAIQILDIFHTSRKASLPW